MVILGGDNAPKKSSIFYRILVLFNAQKNPVNNINDA
jgi:hypothetical protein